ncbi:putative enterotoxin [Ophiocordyceps camponoti-rufipedis]|uniref:Putative enterotoxin n=1 Tax=Ophiocordyceps camponoti-rufipedis TaxID=2004952 RepID=A0A2C5ZJ65_9HYPO|nr:putative enterotoxin [Ophiocordyceps camponoti-rufipedis]
MRAAGGFQPRGHIINNYLRVRPNISLYSHIRGAGLGSSIYSGYVSTTTEYNVALNFLRSRSLAPSFIYFIHVTPNFIDVAQSLGEFYAYPDEHEFSALGGIRSQQITGWQIVNVTIREAPTISHLIPNPDYRAALYDFAVSGGAQPQLAGFPPDHRVFREGIQPWCGFRGKKRANKCPLAEQNSTQVIQEYMASSVLKVNAIQVHSRVSSSWAGTIDGLLIVIGQSKPMVLFQNSSSGKYKTLNVDLNKAFDNQEVYISNLTSLGLIVAPFPHPIMSDAFRIESLVLVVNTTLGVFEMKKFSSLSKDVGTKKTDLEKVWGGEITLDDWVSIPDKEDE